MSWQSILFAKEFDEPGIHEIILQNLNDTRFGHSQITFDRFDLEIVGDTVPVGATTVTGPLGTVTGAVASPAATPHTQSTNLAPIVGGIVAGFVLIIVGILLWYCFYFRKKRARRDREEMDQQSFRPVVQPYTMGGPSFGLSTQRSDVFSIAESSYTSTDVPPVPTRAVDAGPALPPDYHQVFHVANATSSVVPSSAESSSSGSSQGDRSTIVSSTREFAPVLPPEKGGAGRSLAVANPESSRSNRF
jgi:hypothetical protein